MYNLLFFILKYANTIEMGLVESEKWEGLARETILKPRGN